MLYNVEKEIIMNKSGVIMDYMLTDKQSKLVENNLGLVHMVLKKMNVKGQNYQDSYSEGTLGLIQAAHKFDETRNVKFSTYAVYYIKAFILRYLYPFKKQLPCISLQTPLSSDDVSNGSLGDILINPLANEIEQYTDKESFEEYVNKILNGLFFRQRIIMLYRLAGFTFDKIATYLALSTSRVIQIKNLAIHQLKEFDELTIKYKEVFYFEMKENHYCISFFTSEIHHFNAIFAQFLTKLTTTKGVPSFRIISNSERVTLYLPDDLSSFSFVAQLMEKIDLYGFQYTSSPKNFEPEEAIVITKSDYSNIPQKDLTKLSLTTTIDVKKETHKKTKVTDAIRDYIKKVDTFSIQDILNTVPETNYRSVSTMLSREKKKGSVYSVKPGVYTINKPTSFLTNVVSTEISSGELPSSSFHQFDKPTKQNELKSYILSKREFSIPELQKAFPHICYSTIALIVRNLRTDNLIKKVKQGEYQVLTI